MSVIIDSLLKTLSSISYKFIHTFTSQSNLGHICILYLSNDLESPLLMHPLSINHCARYQLVMHTPLDKFVRIWIRFSISQLWVSISFPFSMHSRSRLSNRSDCHSNEAAPKKIK